LILALNECLESVLYSASLSEIIYSISFGRIGE